MKYYLRRAAFILRKVHQLLALAMKLRLPEAERDYSDIELHLRKRWEAAGSLPIDSMDSRHLVSALTCLAEGLGGTIREIRQAVVAKGSAGEGPAEGIARPSIRSFCCFSATRLTSGLQS